MAENVIKFGKAKKSLARKARTKLASENRTRHGQKKAAKDKRKLLSEKLQSKLDGHKLEKPSVNDGAQSRPESSPNDGDNNADIRNDS